MNIWIIVMWLNLKMRTFFKEGTHLQIYPEAALSLIKLCGYFLMFQEMSEFQIFRGRDVYKSKD